MRLFGVAALLCGVLGGVNELSAALEPVPAIARPRVVAPELPRTLEVPKREAPPLQAMPITSALRKRGYHECYPPDPLGLGPYAPLRNLSMGRIAIPRRGGHTPDKGFDVLLHFHGMDPLRKTLVQVARGVVLAGIDRGIGSGRYADSFKDREVFPTLRRSIEHALRRHTGDQRAHIRHLALTAWSAGYGAINEILRRGDEGIDAVVLLDALHAGWSLTGHRDGTLRSVSGDYVAPIFRFAERARRGEKIFVLTHSNVNPVSYPSVRLTSDLLLAQLELERQPLRRDAGLLEQRTTVDAQGLHVWSYAGNNELTHCAHISLIADVLRDVLENQWDTPRMDRSQVSTARP
jgi:hypothetical protein